MLMWKIVEQVKLRWQHIMKSAERHRLWFYSIYRYIDKSYQLIYLLLTFVIFNRLRNYKKRLVIVFGSSL